MNFSHRDDPARTATITAKDDTGNAWVVQQTDAAGKVRSKSFTNGYLAALRFVLNKEGYVVRGPQDGPVRWMARLVHDYQGELTHAVDAQGDVWLVDPEGQLVRIRPDTLETAITSLRGLAQGNIALACRADAVWIVAPFWDKSVAQPTWGRRLLRVAGAVVDEVFKIVGTQSINTVDVGADGSLLGPGARGAAFYDAQGGVLEEVACEPLPTKRESPPFAALSPSGRWLATTHADGIHRLDRSSGQVVVLLADFESVNGLQLADDGELFVSGFRYPSHGVYHVDGAGQRRISADIRATVLADGQRFVEAEHSRVTLRRTHVPSSNEMELRDSIACLQLPVLGMAKYGCALPVGDELVVLTDAYTVAGVRLPK